MRKRAGPTERDLEEKAHADAKRRSVIGDECAAARIRDAIARFLNPKDWGEPSELDTWILLHMGSVDFVTVGHARNGKRLSDIRDGVAAAICVADPSLIGSVPCALNPADPAGRLRRDERTGVSIGQKIAARLPDAATTPRP